MDFSEIVLRWREFGAAVTVILVLAKIGDKSFAWILDLLGVKIKRSQSREDSLGETVAKMRGELDEVKEDVVQLKGAYKIVHDVAHKSADGIERELTRANVVLPTVQFFIDQLRTVQAVEDILKD